ncbi:MAG: hypothetical protein AABP62_30445 [Planctomycetota bacterium]
MATRQSRSAPNSTAKDLNKDPLTGEPGAHPVGVGIGAALGGAVAGAAAGAVGGPVGAAVGAVVGGVAGGYAGKSAGEAIDPTVEDAYWRENYPTRPYYAAETTYDTYAPAYRYGWESAVRYDEQYDEADFDTVEPKLQEDWEKSVQAHGLEWERAKHATRDAWGRAGSRRRGESISDAISRLP